MSHSFHFGGNVTYPIKNNWYLRSGLHFNQLNAREYSTANVMFFNPTNLEIINTKLRDDYHYRCKYLAIPLVGELHSEKAIFHLGFQFMFLAKSTLTYQRETFAPVTFEKTTVTNTYEPDFLNPLNIGIRAGYSFKVKPFLSIDLNGYISTTNIINEDSTMLVFDRRHRQITLGVSYYYL